MENRMQVFFLAALAFALVAVLFALQNIVPVRVTFLAWTFEGSLALVMFVTLIAGALVSFLLSVPSIIKARLSENSLKKQVAALEQQLGRLTPPIVSPPATGRLGDDSVDAPSASQVTTMP
jgi:lipopolysaccharide assembly protein A